MKTVCLALLLLLAAPMVAAAQAATENPMDQIAWLVGTWTADVNKGATHIESQISWSENRRGLRFVTWFTTNGKREAHYEGIYAWHPVKKKIGFWYTAYNGNFTEGYLKVDGGTLDLEFEILSEKGAQSYQSKIVRQGNEAYNWRLFSTDGKELINITYKRQK